MLKRTVENIQKVSYILTGEDVGQAIVDYVEGCRCKMENDLSSCCVVGRDPTIIFNADGSATVTSEYIIENEK